MNNINIPTWTKVILVLSGIYNIVWGGLVAEVCQSWEEEAKKAETYGVRVVPLRTGLVLGVGLWK